MREGRVQLFTRRGYDWTDRFESVALAAWELKTYAAIMDGEVIVPTARGQSDFHAPERDLGAGRTDPPHRHPGHHTFGYVVEGTYEFAVDGQPSRLLNAGETFYEPPTAVHSVSRNPSTNKRTTIIVFMVAEEKNPSTVAE